MAKKSLKKRIPPHLFDVRRNIIFAAALTPFVIFTIITWNEDSLITLIIAFTVVITVALWPAIRRALFSTKK